MGNAGYQISVIMTVVTAGLLPAGWARLAPPPGETLGRARHKRIATRPAGKRTRPSVAIQGAPGGVAALDRYPASRCAPRLPRGPLDRHQKSHYHRDLV